jgi:hypothetical protein
MPMDKKVLNGSFGGRSTAGAGKATKSATAPAAAKTKTSASADDDDDTFVDIMSIFNRNK